MNINSITYPVSNLLCTFSCLVYGFDIPGQPLESPTFTGVESTDRYTLPIRMIKGRVGNRVDLNAEVLPGGTAGGTRWSCNYSCELCDFYLLFLTLQWKEREVKATSL